MSKTLRTPDESVIRALTEVYERGLTLDALARAREFAPLGEWDGAGPCVLAARLAANAGAARLAKRLAVRALRSNPRASGALAQYGYEVMNERGPLALWRLLRDRHEEFAGGTDEEKAELLCLKGLAACELRDFSNAEQLLTSAEALDPARPWIRLQRARLFERLDRVEDALVATGEAIDLHPHPFFRAGVQTRAHLLQLLDRDGEAIALLQAADAVIQNGPVVAQLYAILSENGRWSEAETALERFVALSPLLEKPLREWVAAQRARVAYHVGRRDIAAGFARTLDDDFHRRFAEKLTVEPPERERVHLEVGFVRQHFKTCAPATLAALGRYWEMPAEHLQLAEAMCYDGTPHWQQRQWAEDHGWLVREFSVTGESAVALIERGVPFAIAVVDATSAHMMAVVGFDRTRGTLLLRDPGQPYTLEAPTTEFLKRYAPFGPHGMVFIPEAGKGRLEGLVLPDAEARDEFHCLRAALARNDRPTAAERCRRLDAAFAGHFLTWEARLDLATYDANETEQARCLHHLLELFPNTPARQLRRFRGLREAPWEERVRFLREACAAEEADPALLIELARTLQTDARCLSEARLWLRRGARRRPVDAVAQAEILWGEGRLEEATEIYRFAANLESFREDLYQTWFVACRRTRRTDEALAHLQDRFHRFGARSEQPALTLAWAWREVEQPRRAREVLGEAARLRPDDGQLLLRSAGLVAQLGDAVEAAALLEAARPKVRPNDWLRTAAEIAEGLSDQRTALQRAREILELEPLALDAHAGVTRLLARLEGPKAARAHLESACAAFPHHYGLRHMLVEWSRDTDPAAAAAGARKLLQLAPSDPWALRELALALSRANRHEEALREAEEAVRAEPRNSYSHSVHGHLLERLGRLDEAAAALRRAVELSVDNGDAMDTLLNLTRTDEARKRELAFIEQQLIEQVVAGDGLLAFLSVARPVLDPESLLQGLRRAHTERPDLWHAGSALVSQLGHMGRLDEALDLAHRATERFPHLPRIWLDLAIVHRWRSQPEEEIAAAEHAFEISPAWPPAALTLTDALERCGRLDASQTVHERALQHAPNDAQLHASYAHLLWRQRRTNEAFAAVERALRLAPGHEWAWNLLQEWANDRGEPDRVTTLARSLTLERPGEARVWLVLVGILSNPDDLSERRAAVDRALALEPHSTEAWDAKATLLTEAEQFDDALRACEEGIAACTVDVHLLRGRQAWIEAQRRRLPEAVERMRAVLAENASYAWGWSQLAAWLVVQEAHQEASTALEQLVQLQPYNAWVHRQLGFLRLKQDDLEGARKSFATTLRLTPTDAAAAANLLDLQIREGDDEAATATLRLMQTHQPGARTLAAAITLDLRAGEPKAALRGLRELCTSPDPDPRPINEVTLEFQRIGPARRAVRVLQRALKAGSCNPQVAAALIRLLILRNQRPRATRVFLRLPEGEARHRAVAPLVQGLVAGRSRFRFWWILRRRGRSLARDDESWGHVGYGLITLNRMRAGARWMADWRTRRIVQPWMLFNYCLALRDLGRYDEANAVARHVVDTWGHREGAADLHLFLAVEEALAGAVEPARQHLASAVVRKDVAHDQALSALAGALLEHLQTPREERPAGFSSLRDRLSLHFPAGSLPRFSKDLRRTFRRTGKVMAGQGAGWRARLWFGWRLHWQWLAVAAGLAYLGRFLRFPD